MTYQQKSVARKVFRAYDIRGIIGLDLDEDAFYSIGISIAALLYELKETAIFLGKDARLTSPRLAKALKEGLLQSGIEVLDLGEVTTPMLYYATHKNAINSGLMVTGSHNPGDYNGIKIVLAGKTLTQTDIDRLYEQVAKETQIKANTRGLEKQLAIFEEYRQEIVNNIALKRPLKVVVDCGNGIAGPFVPQVLHDLGCEVLALYCEPDGRFPNHHPDPSIEANLADLKAKVLSEKADLGLAFDGDADRLGVVCNKGEMIQADRLMMLYSQELLKQHPDSTIVFDVKCSALLRQTIKECGGIPSMCPTGHSIVKSMMKTKNAILAGEMSGHLFFKDRWFGFDDALYSACRLLEIIAASHLSIHEHFQLIPNAVCTPELKIDMPDEQKFQFMQRFSETSRFEDADLIRMDGLRAEFANGWGLLRASNTTPCLVARFEAVDEQHLAQIQALFKQQLLQLDQGLILPF